MIVYNRAEGVFFEGKGPSSGTYGQISMRRLCDVLEASGEINAHERITHLEIAGNLMRYRVEMKPKQPAD